MSVLQPDALAAAPSNVVFFKLHKVGGTSFRAAFVQALLKQPTRYQWSSADVEMDSDLLGRGEGSSSDAPMVCAAHQSSLPLLRLFRQPTVLAAASPARVAMMHHLAGSARESDIEKCPLPNGLALRTVILLRSPMERVISKYFYEQVWCPTQLSELAGAQPPGSEISCAANELSLLDWYTTASLLVQRTRSPRAAWEPVQTVHTNYTRDLDIKCEPLFTLGGGEACDDATLTAATATLGQIDVVGITESMDASMQLTERVFGLEPGSMLAAAAQHSALYSRNNSAHKEAVPTDTYEALAALPEMRVERRLYERAVRRFRRDARAWGVALSAT